MGSHFQFHEFQFTNGYCGPYLLNTSEAFQGFSISRIEPVPVKLLKYKSLEKFNLFQQLKINGFGSHQHISISQESVPQLVHTDMLGNVAHKQRACGQRVKVLQHVLIGGGVRTATPTMGRRKGRGRSLLVVSSRRKL